MRLLSAAALALAVSLVLLTPVAAARTSCDTTAKLVSGELHRLTDDQHFGGGATLQRMDPFEAEQRSRILYQDATYTVEAGSQFLLACYGTRREGAIWPRLSLHAGKAKMEVLEGNKGAIKTQEIMGNNHRKRAMTIVVTRAPDQNDWMYGRSEIDHVDSRRAFDDEYYINLTPYVGSRPGKCRQADGGTFQTKMMSDGSVEETAEYREYSPTSVR